MRTITEYRVVIASPSDVYEERKAVFEAVDELNLQLETSNTFVRAIGWEDYAAPGVNIEPQAVINRQLFDNYDMLIAIFGTQLGTATLTARSGTIEEIEKAIASSESVFEDQRIQIYFKDTISNLSKINANELSELLAFKAGLGARGILYRTFINSAELAKAIRVHIQRAVFHLGEAQSNQRKKTIETTKSHSVEIADEPGILDLIETSENSVSEMSTELETLAKIVNRIGDETTKQTKIVEQQNLADISVSIRKASINNFADFLMENAQELLDKSSHARILFRNLYEAQIELQTLILSNSGPNEVATMKNALAPGFSEMLTGAVNARDSVSGYRQSVDALPRITSRLQRAKRRLLEALDENINFLNDIERGILKLLFD